MSEETETTEIKPDPPKAPGGWRDRPAVPRIAPDGFRYSRRWVLVPETDVLRRGRYNKVYGYSVRTLARMTGLKPGAVYKDIGAGKLLPHDLGSVIRWIIANVRPGSEGGLDMAPPLWRFYDNHSLIAAAPKSVRPQRSRGREIPLAVQMPPVQTYEDMARLFWTHRARLRDFSGASYPLARRLLELDGVDPASLQSTRNPSGVLQPHKQVRTVARALRSLARLGVLLYDPATLTWSMAPFPNDLEGVLEGLRTEGFEGAELIERHIAIENDLFSLPMAKRLLAHMRTNRLTAKSCGRDRRLWITTNLSRVFHGYRTRKIFRQPGSASPADPERPA